MTDFFPAETKRQGTLAVPTRLHVFASKRGNTMKIITWGIVSAISAFAVGAAFRGMSYPSRSRRRNK
jgi:hypothetical protein